MGTAFELGIDALNKDTGFITVGQDAVVKLEAFPFTRYGTIAAHVTKIAADAILEPDAARREGDPTAQQAKTTFGGAEIMWTSRFSDITEPETY
nr:HlyD family secretion protein [Rhizobium leguminosarum]